jgi:hypothetical protein
VAWVRERTIPTDRPPFVGEVGDNFFFFCGEGATWLARRIPTAVISVFLTGATTFEAEWTPFQTHYFSENLVAPVIEPGPLDL